MRKLLVTAGFLAFAAAAYGQMLAPGEIALESDLEGLAEYGLGGAPADEAELEFEPEGISHDPAEDAPPAEVSPETLAEMQASLRGVAADLQALRAELVASGAEGFAAVGGDGALDRMNALEAKIAGLTDRLEQLENRVRRIVADGTARLGDLEFRLCEMDAHCDLGALMTAELGAFGVPALDGGQVPGPNTGAPDLGAVISTPLPPPDAPAPEFGPATPEEARHFQAAQDAIAEGDHARALDILDRLISSHSGGPLTAEALFMRGETMEAQGAGADAGATWLEAYAADPGGPRAAPSLLRLARALSETGPPERACPFWAELVSRYEDRPEAAEAEAKMAEIDCLAPGGLDAFDALALPAPSQP
ncbi:MAG: tol-pal system protein [Paracoccus sp. (in: a-proteobacteria)]|nr:tol-pal system protein [Paracoccus sp. (in: a-proteobacteria)]